MSLVVWLPLNGNLDNQGLSNVTVTNNGATVDNNGKIGKCYKFDGTYLTISTGLPANPTVFSFCSWVKLISGYAVNNGCHLVALGNNCRICVSKDGAAIRFIGNNATVLCSSSVLSNELIADVWYHIAVIFDNGNVRMYLNGAKVADSDVGATSLNLSNNMSTQVGSYTTELSKAYMNDFRIYDHALSAKEVKELFKGLVLHYRLAGPGGNNLIPGTSIANVSSEWSANGWGHTKLTQYDSINGIYKIVATNGWIVNKYKFNPSYVGKTLTISFWAKKIGNETTSTIANNLWLSNMTGSNPYYTSNFSIVDNGGTNTTGSTDIPTSDVWMKYVGTCVLNTDGQLGIGCYCSPENNSLKTTYLIKELKVEEGSVATPWCPNPADALYSAMGYNNIEYDCSGYRRNGTKSGTITWDIDSPRYTTSYNFSKSGYIYNNSFGITTKEYTISLWVKLKPATSQHFLFGTFDSWTGNGIGFYRDANQLGLNCVFKSDGESSWGGLGTGGLSVNTWYMITYTSNGTIIKRYLNGIYKDSLTYGKGGNTLNPVFYIANSKFNGTPVSENEEAFISDVRFYTTALSAEDIAELYHSAVIVDNTGKNYAYEYFEAN